MTRLDCTVTSCLYNKERCCCKDNIEVEGSHARHSGTPAAPASGSGTEAA